MKAFFFQTALSIVMLSAAVSACCCAAQAPSHAPDDLTGLRVENPKGTPTPTPFSLDVRTGRVQTLEFRAPDAMTEADRALAASAQGEIARRAALVGLHFDGEGNTGEGRAGADGWGYEQAVCPAFPEHLVLEYSRSNGAGDVTMFSAVVPRGGDGHVRVIPVRRRGYSLFTPSSMNAITLNDFNHMVKEGGLSPDWLTLTLCYGALAGGHVRATLQAEKPGDEHYPLFAPALLTVSDKGGAQVDVVDAADQGKRARWKFEFAQSGRLLKVKRMGASALVEIPTKEQPPQP